MTLMLAHVARLSPDQVETTFAHLCWPMTACVPGVWWSGPLYDVRRPKGPPRWRRKADGKGMTSGTLFASRKMDPRGYLMAGAVAMNEVKGKNALAPSRDSALPTRPVSSCEDQQWVLFWCGLIAGRTGPNRA
jgi:hypothetical protein